MKKQVFQMLRSKCKQVSLCMWVACAAMLLASCGGSSVKTVLNPAVAQIDGDEFRQLSIDKVILTDAMTILDCSYDTREGGFAFVNSKSYLEADGKQYPLLGTKNIFTVNRTAELVHYKKVTFSLIFQPVPLNTGKLDFYESETGWKVKGIDLETGSNAVRYDNLDAGMAYAATIDSVYEAQEQAKQTKRAKQPQTGNSFLDQAMRDGYPLFFGGGGQEVEHTYYCASCNTLVTAKPSNAPRPNSGQCAGSYHQWFDYGKVGNKGYQCSECEISIQTDGRPSSDNGCRASSQKRHRWVQRF